MKVIEKQNGFLSCSYIGRKSILSFVKKSTNKIWFLILKNISFFCFFLLDSKCFWERYLCVCQFFQIQLCFLVLGFGFNWNIINTKAFSCALYTRNTLLLCCTFLWVFLNWKKFFSKSFRPDLANSSRDARNISATQSRSWLSLRCNRAFFKVGLTSFLNGKNFLSSTTFFMGVFSRLLLILLIGRLVVREILIASAIFFEENFPNIFFISSGTGRYLPGFFLKMIWLLL